MMLAIASHEAKVFLIAAVFLCLRGNLFTRCKAIYQLTIGNAGTEFTGTTSYSRDYIAQLHSALSE